MKLDELLRNADAAALPPAADRALGARVRARSRRRSQSRAACAGLALLAAACAVYWNLSATHSTTGRNAIAVLQESSDALEELRNLRAEGDAHARLAQRLCASELAAHQRERLQRALEIPNALEEISSGRDQSAAALVRYGDRVRAKDGAEAARSYRCVVANFAGSSSASAARERLIELK